MSAKPAESSKTRREIKPSTLSPFRYPGGKSRLRAVIIEWILQLGFRPTQFVEPFAGGASVGLAVAELDLADHVTLAEIDPDVSAVWEIVLNGQARRFAKRIRTFKLTHASAEGVAAGSTNTTLSRAFRCLLLNRISRGGIMAPGAGWLNKGENGHGIHSRWYPDTLADRVETSNALRNKVTFVNGDGLQVLKEFAGDPHAVAFVDPPYVVRGRGAGRRLYAYCDVDCDELFEIIRTFAGAMVITYHRSAIVQRLADAAGLECHTVTVQTGHTGRKRELIMYKSPS
jgi:DNA adenine methylase